MKESIFIVLILSASMFANAQENDNSNTWKLSGITASFGDALGRTIWNPNGTVIIDNAEDLTIDNDFQGSIYRTRKESLSPQFSVRAELEKKSNNEKLSSLINFGARYTSDKNIGSFSHTFVTDYEDYTVYDWYSYAMIENELSINASIEQKINYRFFSLAVGIGSELGTSINSQVLEMKNSTFSYNQDFQGEWPELEEGYQIYHKGKNRLYARVMVPLTVNIRLHERFSLEPRFQLGVGALKTVGGKAQFLEQTRTFDVGLKYSFK